MSKSNIKTTNKSKKNAAVYATISAMAAFALIASPFLLSGNMALAVVPQTPETSGCDPNQDTDCFPDDIIFRCYPYDDCKNTKNSQSDDIEMSSMINDEQADYLVAQTKTAKILDDPRD